MQNLNGLVDVGAGQTGGAIWKTRIDQPIRHVVARKHDPILFGSWRVKVIIKFVVLQVFWVQQKGAGGFKTLSEIHSLSFGDVVNDVAISVHSVALVARWRITVPDLDHMGQILLYVLGHTDIGVVVFVMNGVHNFLLSALIANLL